VDGGGLTFATGGDFELGGTAGQPDAGPLGGAALYGGFWSPADGAPSITLGSVTRDGSALLHSLTDRLSLNLVFPPGATEQRLALEVQQENAPAPPPGLVIGEPVRINAYTAADRTPVTQFAQPFRMTVQYDDATLNGADEATLALLFWEEASSQWSQVPATLDGEANNLNATLDHLTTFALVAQASAPPGSQKLFLPLVAR
jgi:hypothetical protein